MALILLVLLLACGWVVGGLWLDDREDEAECSTTHRPRHAAHKSTTVLIGGSR